MKKIINLNTRKIFNRAMLSMFALIASCYSFAQDKKVEIDINTKPENNTNFFMQPWVWIVGGAVFILLLVALLRGSGSKK